VAAPPSDTGAWLAAQHSLVRILAESPTLDEAAPRALGVIGDLLGWRLGKLWLADEEAGVLRPAYEWRASGLQFDGFRDAHEALAPGVGLPGRVWASREPLWIADVSEDPSFTRASAAAAAGLHAGIGLPVHGEQGVVGVMEYFAREVHEPDPALLELLWAFGRLLGQELERRRADRRLQASEELKSAIIGSALDCVIVMDHRGCVTDFNPAAERTFGWKRSEVVGIELAQLIVPPEMRDAHRQALQRVVTTGEARILNRRVELIALRADGARFPVELTVTQIGTTRPPMFAGFVRDITDRRRAAGEVARLLEREQAARAHAQRAERRARQIATTLQRSLLPPLLPDVPNLEIAAAFQPAGEGIEVGGDFYDVFATADGRWAAVIGDVCGKGSGAAAVTALARYTLRAAAMREHSPSATLRLLNQALLARTEEPRIISTAYLLIAPEADGAELSLALAGHPPPLLLRADGEVELVEPPGILLGVVKDPAFSDHRLRLHPGDAIILYTDGVTDAFTPQGRFGIERLTALLGGCSGTGAREIVRRIETSVALEPPRHLPDDIAVLVLRMVAAARSAPTNATHRAGEAPG
jgi:PAS domain S-box-containing protein